MVSAGDESLTDSFTIHDSEGDEQTAKVMARAVRETQAVLEQRWGLPFPSGCRVYVLTDWRKFISQSAPPLYRPLALLTRPLWRAKAERIFKLAGGWNLPWPGAPAVGVKPPRLRLKREESLGRYLFVPVDDPDEKTRQLTCHELTHAFTSHLKLPVWLNEGLAMRAVDHLIGGESMLPETKEIAADSNPPVAPLVRIYADAYWRVRALDESHHDELCSLLEKRRSAREIQVWYTESGQNDLNSVGRTP